MKIKLSTPIAPGLFTLILASACQSPEVSEASSSTTATRPEPPKMEMTTDIPEGILTPDQVETSIGTLNFYDGVPLSETRDKLYDYLDRMRAVDVFLKCMPAASVRQLMLGPAEIGADDFQKIVLTEDLMDSKPLFLTANTSTMYVVPYIDLRESGPMVVEAPPGMLGAFNDAWFRYIADIGPFGPDKGQGGKFLVIPPDYKEEIPDGYFLIRPKTYRVWTFMRTSIANGVEAAANKVKDNLKVYPLTLADNPPANEFINGSGKSFNTIHDNDINFYYHVNEVIQEEPIDMIDPETRGLLASVGIEKGKEFNPDERMRGILMDAVAIANGIARSIVWYPRVSGFIDNMSGIEVYPDANSAWIMGWVDKNVFFNGRDGHTMNSDARVMFHYPYTAVTPAMAVTIEGKGSDYAIALLDAKKEVIDGGKTYKIHLPPNPPANDFWALTVYDPQTRSQLQTDQQFPTVGSQTEGIKVNEDGSYDIYCGPEAPEGFENNWLQTVPNKSWFVALRIYGPTETWINKTWRPSEIEKVGE